MPSLAWMYERARLEEDVVIHECPSPFDDGLLENVLGVKHNIHSNISCSTDLGVPVLRRRKWTALVRKSGLTVERS